MWRFFEGVPWDIDAKHKWSVWEGVEGITVFRRLVGVSLCKKTSSDETILGSAFPLFGLNCKCKIKNECRPSILMRVQHTFHGYYVHGSYIWYIDKKRYIYPQIFHSEPTAGVITETLIYFGPFCMYIYAEIATSGVNNWAILRDWHGGVLTNLVISYPILELASIVWYHWMCNIQEGTIHMLTYSYTESNQPQRIKIRATPIPFSFVYLHG